MRIYKAVGEKGKPEQGDTGMPSDEETVMMMLKADERKDVFLPQMGLPTFPAHYFNVQH